MKLHLYIFQSIHFQIPRFIIVKDAARGYRVFPFSRKTKLLKVFWYISSWLVCHIPYFPAVTDECGQNWEINQFQSSIDEFSLEFARERKRKWDIFRRVEYLQKSDVPVRRWLDRTIKRNNFGWGHGFSYFSRFYICFWPFQPRAEMNLKNG